MKRGDVVKAALALPPGDLLWAIKTIADSAPIEVWDELVDWFSWWET